MAAIKQTFTGDTSQLEKELASLQKEIIKVREENAKTAKDSIADTRAQERALKRFADTVKRDVATPLENYRRDLQRLRDAHKAGHLSQEEYRRGVDRLKQSVRQASPEYRELQRQIGETNRKQREADKGQQNLFGKGIQRVGAYAAGWVSVSEAISLANRRLQEQIRLDAEARGEQVSVSGSEAKVKRNLFLQGVEGADRQRFLDQVKEIQSDTGIDIQSLNLAAAAGISASSGKTQATLDALRASAGLVPDEPGALGSFTGAALDIGKASGVADARRNLAFLLSVGTQSRVEDSALQSKAIPQAVFGAAATDTGADRQRALREAGAVFSTLTAFSTDKTGEKGRTATLQLAGQLREFFQQEGRTDPSTLFGRIQSLQSDAELRQAFLSEASFEQIAKLPVEKLLAPDSNVAQQLRSSFGQINFDSTAVSELSRDITGGNAQAIVAQTERRLSSTLQQRQTADNLAARRDLARQAIAEVADRTTGGFFSDSPLELAKAAALTAVSGGRPQTGNLRGGFIGIADQQLLKFGANRAIDAGANPEAAAISALRQQEEAIRRGTSFNLAFGDRGRRLRSDAELSPQERSNIEFIREQISIMEKLLSEIEGMRSDLKQNPLPRQPVAIPQTEQHR